ncbi:MAG: hypothetical protein HKL81_10780, partial [Acidimicrobiaceae bacterium]|nr:hypothetical protein [Acidimicrobiaceae bacterium]
VTNTFALVTALFENTFETPQILATSLARKLPLAVIGKLMNSVQKSVQKIQGKARCEACNSRLKAVNGKYATTCRKCGMRQSWA